MATESAPTGSSPVERMVGCCCQSNDAVEVKVYAMFDCHLFRRIHGATVDEVIVNWATWNAKPHPAEFEDGRRVDDLGSTDLCEAIVLGADGKELRRVGKAVQPDYRTRRPDNAQVQAYRMALLSDPDIPRLLAAANAK